MIDDPAFYIKKEKVASSFNQSAPHYDKAAVLQREVATRVMERFDFFKIQPGHILDLGAGTGYAMKPLNKRFPGSTVIALDIALEMLRVARNQTSTLQRFLKQGKYVCGDAEVLPFKDHTFDLIFSNLTLQWCNHLEDTFSEIHRILKPGGLVIFSTCGPGTLSELRTCWSGIDKHTHVNAFIDMHDIGDALLRNGFETPVMDTDQYTLTYPDLKSLSSDLKALGVRNMTSGRPHSLTPKRHYRALHDAYENFRTDGRLPATYEIIFGHAWSPLAPSDREITPHRTNEAFIPVESIMKTSPENP